MRLYRHAPFAVGLTLGLSALATTAQPFSWTVVARSGQAAPGTGASYDSLGVPALNDGGRVAFRATLVGPTANAANNAAIFTGAPDSLSLLVRSGTPVPEAGPGVTLASIDYFLPRFNEDGHALFGSALLGPGIDPNNNFATYAFWLATPAGVRKVAPSSAAGGAYYTPVLTTGDRAAWVGASGIQVWSPANPDPPPGEHAVEKVVLNPAGALAFLAGGVVAGTPGNGQVVARAGDPAPETVPGTQFSLPLFPTINAAGQVAFSAYLAPGSGPGPDPDDSIWAGAPGSLGLVARQRSAAPGTGGLRYLGFFGDIDSYRTIAISPAGEAAFTAALADDQRLFETTGLFAGRPGQVRLVALQGQHAPNAPDGLTVGQLTNDNTFTINAGGRMVFLDDSGNLYAAGVDGTLMLVAGTGLPFEVAPGDTRTIADIAFGEPQIATGGEDGRSFGFNDAGQLTFRLGFTDGTSAVVFTTVPEPKSGVFLSLAGVLALTRRRAA